MSQLHNETNDRCDELVRLLMETVDENSGDMNIGDITSALLVTLILQIGKCPASLRQEMIRRFRSHLVNFVETKIEAVAQELLLATFAGGSEA